MHHVQLNHPIEHLVKWCWITSKTSTLRCYHVLLSDLSKISSITFTGRHSMFLSPHQCPPREAASTATVTKSPATVHQLLLGNVYQFPCLKRNHHNGDSKRSLWALGIWHWKAMFGGHWSKQLQSFWYAQMPNSHCPKHPLLDQLDT